MAKAVWAFDFDGVVCDSVHESALAAWKVICLPVLNPKLGLMLEASVNLSMGRQIGTQLRS